MAFPGTGKIWMNGQMVDWKDATIHVASHVIHYGTGAFEGIRAYDSKTGRQISIFQPLGPSYVGGFRVATGDVSGDGIADLAYTTSTGSFVRLMDGRTGASLGGFYAYTTNYTKPVNIAIADINGLSRAPAFVVHTGDVSHLSKPEEFGSAEPTLDGIADIILGSILKSKALGRDYGVAVMAEGLVEAIGEKGLGAMSEGQLARYGKIERDPHGNLRMAEVDFGRMIKDRVADKLRELKLSVSLTSKDIGYELRCADPVAFDAEYTRDLGHSAVRFLLSPESGKYGAIISLVEGKTRPLPFETMLNPAAWLTETVDVIVPLVLDEVVPVPARHCQPV